MPIHRVQQGDTILKLAHEHKIGWARIWNHPNNEALRAKRYDPNILLPGDEVFVPPVEVGVRSASTGLTHKFQLKSPPYFFVLYLRDERGEPFANVKYVLKVGGATFSGKTTPEGRIAHEVDPTAREGTLEYWDPADPEVPTKWKLAIGGLDPVDDVRGVQTTLLNLGYTPGPATGSMNEKTKSALKDFQRHIGIENPTGEMDDRTRAALRDSQLQGG
jgi:N-acetylmuramoyl-L-alanine amidase